MSRTSRTFGVIVLCAFVSSAVLAKSFTPKKNTHAEVKAYVKRAAEVVKKKGPDCATFSSKEWMSGDYYIFVSGADEKIICHPNASMIGKDNSTIVDEKGNKVGRMIIDNSKKPGGGWSEYVWPRPGETKAVAKSSYSMQVKGPDGKVYMLGAGGYELK